VLSRSLAEAGFISEALIYASDRAIVARDDPNQRWAGTQEPYRSQVAGDKAVLSIVWVIWLIWWILIDAVPE
jgi:hypothetical protein